MDNRSPLQRPATCTALLGGPWRFPGLCSPLVGVKPALGGRWCCPGFFPIQPPLVRGGRQASYLLAVGKSEPAPSILHSFAAGALCASWEESASLHCLQCLASILPLSHGTASLGVLVPLGNLSPNSRARLPVPWEGSTGQAFLHVVLPAASSCPGMWLLFSRHKHTTSSAPH